MKQVISKIKNLRGFNTNTWCSINIYWLELINQSSEKLQYIHLIGVPEREEKWSRENIWRDDDWEDDWRNDVNSPELMKDSDRKIQVKYMKGTLLLEILKWSLTKPKEN